MAESEGKSNNFPEFFTFLLILGFLVLFWGAFKAGNIKENPTVNSVENQNGSQYQIHPRPNRQ